MTTSHLKVKSNLQGHVSIVGQLLVNKMSQICSKMDLVIYKYRSERVNPSWNLVTYKTYTIWSRSSTNSSPAPPIRMPMYPRASHWTPSWTRWSAWQFQYHWCVSVCVLAICFRLNEENTEIISLLNYLYLPLMNKSVHTNGFCMILIVTMCLTFKSAWISHLFQVFTGSLLENSHQQEDKYN